MTDDEDDDRPRRPRRRREDEDEDDEWDDDRPRRRRRPRYDEDEDDSGDAGLHYVIPVNTSGLAIAAGYVGLISVLCFPAPVALILGILALRQLNRNPKLHGRGRAIFAIVMGVIFTLPLPVMLYAIVAGTTTMMTKTTTAPAVGGAPGTTRGTTASSTSSRSTPPGWRSRPGTSG